VLLNIQVCWDVTHCFCVSRSWILEEMQYLHLQGQTVIFLGMLDIEHEDIMFVLNITYCNHLE
jgi:hypothetical protein